MALARVVLSFLMKLTFLGTRGEIEARTRRHRMHSSLLLSYRRAKVMIDCGLDWLRKFERLHPDAIVLTHAHPDHAWGLKNGATCPVDATLTRSFVRKRGHTLIGHATVRTQLGWCTKEGVPRAVITHCGSEIVTRDEHKLTKKLKALAAERGVKASIAYDGMKLTLR